MVSPFSHVRRRPGEHDFALLRKLVLPSGGAYDGHWRHDAPSGEGTATLPGGATVHGQWTDGYRAAAAERARPLWGAL